MVILFPTDKKTGEHPPMADRILTRHATPFTASLFFVSAVSGVALFFHAAPGLFHEMHVWLSLVLLLPVALHVWRNWHSVMNYIRRRTLFIPLAISLAVAAVMALRSFSGSGPGGGPGGRAMALVASQPLTTVASLAGITTDDLTQRLAAAGLEVTGPTETLRQISQRSGRDLFEVLSVVPAPK